VADPTMCAPIYTIKARGPPPRLRIVVARVGDKESPRFS
jgi:hypothetical protein